MTFGSAVRLNGMLRPTKSLRTALALGALGAVGLGATVAGAVETASVKSRTVPITKAIDGMDTAYAQGTVRLGFPASWEAKTGKTSLVVKKKTSGCSYTITAKMDYVLLDRGTDTAPAVEAAAPATGPYLLDSGTRGTMSWRVTRPKDPSSTRTRLLAVRLAPSAITPGAKAPLPAGKQAYARTIVKAIDGVDDECHTGTYRNSLGPAIGDALATQKGQGFLREK